MRKSGIYVMAVLLIGSSGATAWAEENESTPASFSLQFSGLRWSQSGTKYSDETSKREVSSLMTGDLVDSLVWATIGKVNLYFYPFQDVNSLVSLSYMVRDDLELGVDLGLNANKTKEPKSELSSDLLGAFVTWSVPVEDYVLEHFAVLDVTRTEATEINSSTNEEETNKVTGNFFKISSSIVIPIAKNAYYMAGVWWAAENGKNHATDTTRTSTQFGLTLAGLRLTVD
jgi:hypothetical protein